MFHKKLKVLKTYKQTAIIPFDSIGTRIAFMLENDALDSVQINITWHLLFAIICINLYLGSLICFLLFEANAFVEFSDTFFPIATILVANFICILHVIVRSRTIEIIDNLEMVIEKRKTICHWPNLH